MWYKKAKNAELQGLRFSISFSQMRNELDRKGTTYFKYSNKKSKKMNKIRKTGWIICLVLFVLCSCNSAKHASKKRRKMAPCDCPKFNYVPQNDFGKDVAYYVAK